jgi:hypothetical protein
MEGALAWLGVLAQIDSFRDPHAGVSQRAPCTMKEIVGSIQLPMRLSLRLDSSPVNRLRFATTLGYAFS